MRTIGTFTEVSFISNIAPKVSLADIDAVLKARSFTRWASKNKRVIKSLAISAPLFTLSMFDLGASSLFYKAFLEPVAIPVVAGGESFLSGHGVILLHMMIIGFLTLVITTFLKFTGRGDLIPLIVFVGGGAILFEVIGMFRDIYGAVAGFLKM